MNKRYSLLLPLVATALLLHGCDQPTIDTSDDHSTEDSLALVRISLPAAQREEFDEALRLLAYIQIGVEDVYASGRSGEIIRDNKIRKTLHGKTGAQIIEEGTAIRLALQAEQQAEDLQEIRELEQKRQSAISQQEGIGRFQVLESTFHRNTNELLGFSPIYQAAIRLTVRNDTPDTVARAYFEGALISPGREEPWVEDVFGYTAASGLPSRQEAVWEMEAPFFLTNTDAPDDAEFSVSVLRLFDDQDNMLYSTSTFSSEDQSRLEELRQKYGRD